MGDEASTLERFSASTPPRSPVTRDLRSSLLLATVSIAGIGFWLLIAFPFANQNESYAWIPLLSTHSFSSMLTTQLPTVNGFRPLAQATAWILFRLDGHRIYATEGFNAVVTLVAWLLLWVAVPQKRLFALVALLSGGCFFAGYIYVFHLHGVVYPAILLVVAGCFLHATHPRSLRATASLAALTAVAGLYHPAALAVFSGYLLGYALRERRHLSRGEWLLITGLITASALAFFSLSTTISSAGSMTPGMVSFQMLTPRSILSLMAVLFAATTFATWPTDQRTRIALVTVALISGAGLLVLGWPTAILWVVACFGKAALLRRWDLLMLLGGTLILPVAMSAVGSPSYAAPAVMASAGVMCVGEQSLERFLHLPSPALALVLVALVVVAVALRAGVTLPVLSRAALPVMAERDKTFQLENAIGWIESSRYRGATVSFNQSAVDPGVDPDAAMDRTQRAPTSDNYIRSYLNWLTRSYTAPSTTLTVTFGDATVPGRSRVYSLHSPYAGTASVWMGLPTSH